MTLRINNITLGLDDDISMLKDKVCKKLRVSNKIIANFKIIKESIDARKKDNIKFNYSVNVDYENEESIVKKLKDRDIVLDNREINEEIVPGNEKLNHRPVIIGMGPAGMFAGLMLARKGYSPVIFERGEDVDSRTKTVDKFWANGILNTESNVQFGEGGAGTFSDGKLTTRIKDKRCDYVLEELVSAGAPAEIIYSGKPHIGTDILKKVVKNIREEIIRLGGEVIFNSKLNNLVVKDGKIKAVVINEDTIPADAVVLAIGHSPRDTYEMLNKNGIFMEAKAFAIGVRVEHPQSFMDEAQYGKSAGHPRLKAADYRVAYTDDNLKRAVYSFCMCPGGEVVAAASENNRLVTNGMSYYKRDKANANSALVVSVSPEDFQGNSPLRGMEFQRHYESLAFNAGGGKYFAPVQLIGDFMQDRKSTAIKGVEPSYVPGWIFSDMRECLPSYVIDMLKIGINQFDKKIRGFAMEDAVLTGIETRTSAPVKLTRNESLESISLNGLYPAGEGAGYAGGIVSAAVDGVKVAENIIKRYFF
ncbi:FAD-dependent oxidoreductase [Clostridium sp. 19966]|uniref:NAD(P)/FAD-dependent oxidoreductase n=1 Tax=Clostridium sp. 19966 TaxID=2768166 RepID=UPI0028DF46AE|nr:FAD-dependent oxidoreductase [Clostridium sp. 19966]MDT8715866.1 FAD-dependent oxidoreductase [Clostridium sp. 19966]